MNIVENMRSTSDLDIRVHTSKEVMGTAAASFGAEIIRNAISDRGEANIIVATGASQFEMLSHLVERPGIDWSRVTAFHLDEYVGLPIDHPASFRLYLWQRFVSKLPIPLRAFHYINAETDAAAECKRLAKLIEHARIDVAFVGIGENGHLAFNDPPADFETTSPYLVVTLDEACRQQQLGEGWFPSFRDVPETAVSMSIHRILESHAIVCTVPDVRKAQALRNSIEGAVCPNVPASILQTHANVVFFTDQQAASLLNAR
jgi:glucosamine-6-phosphate deaminase